MPENEPEKKIFIDEDWKAQAQREKEELAAEQKPRQPEPQPEPEEAGEEGGYGEMPPADLPGLISMLATQAYFALGVLQMEEGEEREPDFVMAKYHIDLLQVLQDKTKGNLDETENRLLDQTLAQARMVFIQMAG